MPERGIICYVTILTVDRGALGALFLPSGAFIVICLSRVRLTSRLLGEPHLVAAVQVGHVKNLDDDVNADNVRVYTTNAAQVSVVGCITVQLEALDRATRNCLHLASWCHEPKHCDAQTATAAAPRLLCSRGILMTPTLWPCCA